MNANEFLKADHILIDLREAARRISISEKHLWTLARTGKLPSVKLGSRRLFDPTALHESVGHVDRAADRRGVSL